jgi:hypothetical protein
MSGVFSRMLPAIELLLRLIRYLLSNTFNYSLMEGTIVTKRLLNSWRKSKMFLKKHCSIVENPIALNDQKKSVHITRLLVPLVLAFVLFAFAGFINSGHAFASTTSTCGDKVRASGEMVGYFDTNEGTLNLIQNTCTGLFHAEAICSIPASTVDFFLLSSPTSVSLPAITYNEVVQTCDTAGQIFETAPHAYVSSPEFCAWGNGSSPNGDAGNGAACITHK